MTKNILKSATVSFLRAVFPGKTGIARNQKTKKILLMRGDQKTKKQLM